MSWAADSCTRYLCAGSVGADIIVHSAGSPPRDGELSIVDHISLHVGGCAANTALALAKLGFKVSLCGHIGDDPLGNYVYQELDRHKIRVENIRREVKYATGCTMVTVSLDGERTFLYAPGANRLLQYDDIAAQIANTDFLHLSDTFLLPNLDGPPAVSLLAQAQKLGVVTSVDTAWDPNGNWLQVLENYLPHTSILFTSLKEARKLVPRVTEVEVCSTLVKCGAEVVALKMGKKGVLVATSSGYTHIPPVPVKAVDTTGAGDCFNAGFLATYGLGASVEQCARVGSAIAAMTIMEFGATSNVKTYQEALQATREFYNVQLLTE